MVNRHDAAVRAAVNVEVRPVTHGTVCALEGKLRFKYVSTNTVFIFLETLYE